MRLHKQTASRKRGLHEKSYPCNDQEQSFPVASNAHETNGERCSGPVMRGEKKGKIRPAGTISREVMRSANRKSISHSFPLSGGDFARNCAVTSHWWLMVCLANLSMLRGSYALLSGYEAATSPSPENQSPFEYPYLAVVRGHLSASPPGSVHYPSVALSVTVLEARALRKRFQWRR